jgi:hypothetical protein
MDALFRSRLSIRGRTSADVGPYEVQVWAGLRDFPAAVEGECEDTEFVSHSFDDVAYNRPFTATTPTMRVSTAASLSPGGVNPVPSTQWRVTNSPTWMSPASWDAIDVQVRFVNKTFNGCCTGGQVYVDTVRLLEGD